MKKGAKDTIKFSNEVIGERKAGWYQCGTVYGHRGL